LLGGAQAAREAERKDRKANAKDNWILGSVYGLIEPVMITYPFVGFGLQYERMLNANIALGANYYYCFMFDGDKGNGIEGFFRVYPWGKTFFIGAALGYGIVEHIRYTYESDNIDISASSNRSIAEKKGASGFAITPELGWKIDFGDAGGFYFQGGAGVTLLLGNSIFYPRWYLGFGYAF